MKMTSDGIEFHGDITIEMPSYMHVLMPEEIIEAQRTEDRRIISCGIHPKTRELVSIDQNGKIYEMAMTKFFGLNFEIISATPVKGGKRVEFDIVTAIVEAETEEIITSSKRCEGEDLTINISV